MSALEDLADATGARFAHLAGARARTETRLGEARERLAGLRRDADVAVVLMGSWGRREVTSGSDEDVLVVSCTAREDVRPRVDELAAVLRPPAGAQEVFNVTVTVPELVRFGLQADDNRNTTRRLLLLLESVPLLGPDAHERALRLILRAYLSGDRRDRRPPRFLLNDVVRYWRTICVDFEGKLREGEQKWALRHAKLRTSRTVLFAGGLLPVLECHHVVADDVEDLLIERLLEPPVDRIARAFLDHDAADAGARALGAYDAFLGLIDDPAARTELAELPREGAASSEVFAEARRLGRELQQGLLALLFEREPLRRLVRQYGVL